MSEAWIGVDFDGTLAEYHGWKNELHVGKPIAPMVERVKRWLAEGRKVRIFTARVWPYVEVIDPDDVLFSDAEDLNAKKAAAAVQVIRGWCEAHLGQALPITCVKDWDMIELWDDRCVQVRANTGEPVGESTRGL